MKEAQELQTLIGGIQKFSTDDGSGIRTTVFLKGCPLRCRWCHNPELISPEQQIIRMPNSCIRCGYCLNHCPQKAIFVNADKEIDIDRSHCNKCMACVKGCFAEGLRAVGKEMTPDEVMAEVVKDKQFYENTGGGRERWRTAEPLGVRRPTGPACRRRGNSGLFGHLRLREQRSAFEPRFGGKCDGNPL